MESRTEEVDRREDADKCNGEKIVQGFGDCRLDHASLSITPVPAFSEDKGPSESLSSTAAKAAPQAFKKLFFTCPNCRSEIHGIEEVPLPSEPLPKRTKLAVGGVAMGLLALIFAATIPFVAAWLRLNGPEWMIQDRFGVRELSDSIEIGFFLFSLSSGLLGLLCVVLSGITLVEDLLLKSEA